MDIRIKELIDVAKTKFGLDNYHLHSHSFVRRVDIFKNTIYTLSMEWFPNHGTVQEEDSNPEGTACIDINVKGRKVESAIFVQGKTYAENGVFFTKNNKADIIKWIEDETGLSYGKQFQLHKEEEGSLLFSECIDGVAVSPAGYIEFKYDQKGHLTFFSIYGQFPPKEMVKEEPFTLSIKNIVHVAMDQLKLVEFPSYEQKQLFPVYTVEEIYVRNDQMWTIPFEVLVDTRSYLKVDKTINWEKSINQTFEQKEMNLIEDVTVEQAFSSDPSPDSFPITTAEQEKCVIAVKDFLRQEYPNDTGKWTLKTLHRDKGYIHAIMRTNIQNNHVFQRKLMIMIDTNSLEVVNYLDNKPMLEMFDQFQAPEKVRVTKEEAYEKIKERFELKPYYVYDFEQKRYVLCGKLDCEYGVNASSGEVVALNDL